jgi:glycosyltransferase involved in cell wall biosynthesis
MRIVIDMQGAQSGSRFRGIGRYTTAFAKHLVREAKDHEVILALNGAFGDTLETIRLEFSSLMPSTKIVVWEPLCPANFLQQENDGRRLASEALREAFLADLNPDVVIVSSMFEGAVDNLVVSIGSFLNSIPTAVILYDLIPLIYSKEYLTDSRAEKWYSDKILQTKKANILLSISESSRKEGLEYLGFSDDAVVNISTGIEADFGNHPGTPIDQVRKKFGITRPYLMYSGASDPRKNLPRLIEAYKTIPSPTRLKYQLLLAGGMPQDHTDALKLLITELGLNKDEVRFTGHITDEDMIALYKASYGFVFPSYHEGFGLPILEAMAFDVPVIGSNISSIPEVIGNEQALFNPFTVSEISAMMERLLTDRKFRQHLVDHSRKQRTQFSWQRTAKLTLATLIEKFGRNDKSTANSYTLLPLATQQRLLTQRVASVLGSPDTKTDELLRAATLIDCVLPRTDKRHNFFVDVSELQKSNQKTGIQRVVSNIFANLLRKIPDNYQVVPVYATRTEDYKVANRFMCEFLGMTGITDCDHVLDFRNGDIFLGLDYQDQIVYDRRDYYERLRNKGVAVYFVVYDLLPQLFRDSFVDGLARNHAIWLKTVSQSDGLICISRSVADELREWLADFGPVRKSPLQLGYFHMGADFAPKTSKQHPSQSQQQVLAKIASQESFLVVSTIEPRKRQEQVLQGFELLWRKGVNVCLVLVGKRGWKVDHLIQKIKNHPERNKRLFWLEGIDDEYLNEVYAASSCLIAASIGEGFGLSLIEAAQHKIPILARDIPVFREVGQEHATYFSGLKETDVADAVQQWRNLKLKDKLPLSENLPWITWAQSTSQLLDVVLHEHWHSQWHSDGTLRYNAADNEIGTEVGERLGNTIETNKKEGFLVYGPYCKLNGGKHRVDIFGSSKSSQQNCATLEITSGQGTKKLGSAPFSSNAAHGVLASIEILVPDNCIDFETRITVTQKADFSFSHVDIKKL